MGVSGQFSGKRGTHPTIQDTWFICKYVISSMIMKDESVKISNFKQYGISQFC